MVAESKLCDGCGKDLSQGGGYAAGFASGRAMSAVPVPLWRCVTCALAKAEAHLQRFKEVSIEGMKGISNASDPDELRTATQDLGGRLYDAVARFEDYPSRDRDEKLRRAAE